MDRIRRLAAAATLLVGPLACVSATADDGLELEAESARPPNRPAGYDRVRARITCDRAQLRYRPGPDSVDNRVVGASDSLLHAGRYVFVQGRVGSYAAPGNLDGYVWINP